MKRSKEGALPLPQHDYGPALQTAMSWLGDRYLLAQSVPRRNAKAQPCETRRPDHAAAAQSR